jgi:hypothetical protein
MFHDVNDWHARIGLATPDGGTQQKVPVWGAVAKWAFLVTKFCAKLKT